MTTKKAQKKSQTKVAKKSAKKKSSVKKAKTSKAPKAEVKTMNIGDFARDLIMEGGRTSEQIITEVKAQFPKSAISGKHVSWYTWKLKKDNIEFPALEKK